MMTFALSKGRIFDEALPLLKSAGLLPQESPESSRRLIFATQRADLRLLIVRASDVPTYVQYGAADLGIAGSDVLAEQGSEGLVQPVDLGIARCRMSVAVPDGLDYQAMVQRGARIRVASKYVQIAKTHFAAKGMHVDLIKLYGSMELAPIVGLADVIVDLVSTGGTLKANGLKEVEKISDVSARLIVNQAALKTRPEKLRPLMDALAQAASRG
ncbi:MAG: ATP phosphoribosyltransferase [Betaproteobacteria bacterium]|jgi:ATP phosphoribosyltransferase